MSVSEFINFFAADIAALSPYILCIYIVQYFYNFIVNSVLGRRFEL